MSSSYCGGGSSRRGRGGGYARGRGKYGDPASFDDKTGDAASALSNDTSDDDGGAKDVSNNLPGTPPPGLPCSSLESFLRDVNGRSYARLKELTGQTFSLVLRTLPDPNAVTVRFSHIQPDPFAPGSQLCVTVRAPFSTRALLHSSDTAPPSRDAASHPEATEAVTADEVAWRRVAAEDFLLRCAHRGLARQQSSFAIQVLPVSQHVLPRSAVQLHESDDLTGPNGFIRVFLRVKLPGHGRRIDSDGIHRILFAELLPIFQNAVLRCEHEALWTHVTSVVDQEWLRRQLRASGIVAFIADGAVLPRTAGDSDLPLADGTAVPFTAPLHLSRTFHLPRSGRTVTGAGLPHGLTLIAGGGFHGKSTLLRALELGVYNHVPDDGRTFVVVDPTAVKIRAEDRRAVQGVDISPFIRNLPLRKDTTAFSTGDASGSTSQAANIMEALELGSTALLLDEDTSATNFMYRDALMEQLVPPAQEPITALVHRVRDLIQHHHVSLVMVVGGSGQYFPMAEAVLVMDAYHVRDATAQARAIVQQSRAAGHSNGDDSGLVELTAAPPPPESVFHFPARRHFQYGPTFAGVDRGDRQGHGGRLKVSGVGVDRLRMGHEEIELGLVEQLVEEGQLNAIAQCLALLYDGGSAAAERLQNDRLSSPAYPPPLWTIFPPAATGTFTTPPPRISDYGQLVRNCEARLRQARLELQTASCYLPTGFTSLPRVFELGAALNRLRTLITARR